MKPSEEKFYRWIIDHAPHFIALFFSGLGTAVWLVFGKNAERHTYRQRLFAQFVGLSFCGLLNGYLIDRRGWDPYIVSFVGLGVGMVIVGAMYKFFIYIESSGSFLEILRRLEKVYNVLRGKDSL